MNSSAIIRSASPTISIPGQTAAAGSDVSFGDFMDQVTDNWAERNAQVRHDAAKNAQMQIRENANAKRNDTATTSAHDDYTKSDAPRTDARSNNDRDDHDRYDDVDAADAAEPHDDPRPTDEHSDVADRESEHAGDDVSETETASADGQKEASADPSEEVVHADQPAVTQNETVAVADPALAIDQTIATGIAAVPGINPASQQSNVAANVNAASPTAAGTTAQPVTGTPAQNAEGTTDGLMNSTALSQPAAGATAKSALNGKETGTATAGNDSFISKVVDAMSGEGTIKSGPETANSGNVGNAVNAGNNAAAQSTANAGTSTPANATAQAAQQSMAGAANIQNMQPGVQTTVTGDAKTAVSATGTAEGSTTQTANGPLTGNSSLTQSNATGQTAHTARSAPAQQVQQQVAVHIRNAASEGVDKISVQLRPEHLGRVDVKLEISHDGRVQGVIQADTRETLDMLRQDSRALQQALKDAGLNADSQSFTFEHRNEGGQSQEGNGQSRMANNSGSAPEEGDVMSGAELAEHVAIGYGINPNGLVDIRI